MLVEPTLEVRVRRRGQVAGVLDEELHLLPQPPPDDRVVAVEAHRDGLARRDLLLDVIVDQALQLRPGGRPLPCPREPGGQVLDQPGGDRDARRAGPGAAALPLEEEEEESPEREEVDEGLAEKELQAGAIITYPVFALETC